MTSPLIETKNLSIFRGQQCILKNIDIQIEARKTTAFMGPSGVGKSSLLRILSGQEDHKFGQIYRYNSKIGGLNKTGILFQNNALLLDQTVFENIALPIQYHYELPTALIEELVMMKLRAVNLEHAAELYPEQLSGGMARRAAIARSIVLDPNLIFYDEPFAGQDPGNAEIIARLIKKMSRNLEATSVIITHEIQLTMQLADYLYIFDKQSIAFYGTPQEALCSKNSFVKTFLKPSLTVVPNC